MQRQAGGVPAFLLLLVAAAVVVVLVIANSQPAPQLSIIVPTQQATAVANAWEQILEQGFGEDSTPLPTVAIPTANFVPPTLALNPSFGATPISASELNNVDANDPSFSVGVPPTLPPATVALLSTAIPLTEIAVTRPATSWQPPPLIPPISRDVLGRDHYYFRRPVDSSAANKGLFYYPFGSDGPTGFNMRIHTGIDMPNDIGQAVRAAGEGTVVWAGPGFQNSPSYGNVVLIEHDFGYEGRRLYTLYAHLAGVLAVTGQFVQIGDPIGLVGNTGNVTGPHVHFEVRLADVNSTDVASYGDTYNPVLWMASYVGTGVIAGRVSDRSGNLVMDADITIRNWATGLNVDTTTTYIFQNTAIDVNSDPVWQENFAVGDVPVGRYEVIANIGGERVSKIVNVIEGTTSFVEIAPGQTTAPTPAEGESGS